MTTLSQDESVNTAVASLMDVDVDEREVASDKQPASSDESRFLRSEDRFRKAENGLKLDLQNLVFIQYSGSSERKSIRPGGAKLRTKQFINKSKRVSRKKKLGVRVSYRIEALISFRKEYKEFPINCDPIESLLEEGLGPDTLYYVNGHVTLNKQDDAKKPDINESTRTGAPKFTNSAKSSVVTSNNNNNNAGKNMNNGDKSDVQMEESKDEKKEEKKVMEEANNSAAKPISKSRKWIPSSRRGPKSAIDVFRSKLGFMLNKITLDNFSVISRQVISFFENDVNKVDELKLFVSSIFDKTIHDPLYGPLYAKLCADLSAKEKQFRTGTGATGYCGFKNVLVEQCEIEFGKGYVAPEMMDTMSDEDRVNAEKKAKDKVKNRMKFIGQLYMFGLLKCKIILLCLEALINVRRCDEMTLEAACVLLDAVGKVLDSDPNGRAVEKIYQDMSGMVRRHGRFGTRIGILVKNLIEKRKNGWKTSKPEDDIGEKARNLDMDGGNDKNRININNNNNNDRVTNNGDYIADDFDDDIDSRMRLMEMADNTNAIRDIFNYGTANGSSNIGSLIPTDNGRRMGRPRSRYAQSRGPGYYSQPSNEYQQNQYNGANTVNNVNNYENGAVQSRFLMKSKKLGGENDTVSTNNKNNNNNYAVAGENDEVKESQIEKKVKKEDVNRPCMNGEELSMEKLMEWLDKYLVAEDNCSMFLSRLNGFKLPREKFLSESLRKALDRDTQQQERLVELYKEMYSQNYINSSEMVGMFSEFFEFYTMELGDNPKLGEHLSAIIGALIYGNILHLGHVKNWLELDRDLFTKAISKRKDQCLTCGLEFIAHLLKSLRDEDSEWAMKLLAQERNGKRFDVDSYFASDEIKMKWAEHWKMHWLE